MPIDWSPLVTVLHRHRTFLLMTHVRPDGDGMGAQLALADALRTLGKAARVVIASPLPERYRFLDPDRTAIEEFTPESELLLLLPFSQMLLHLLQKYQFSQQTSLS